MMSLKKWWRDAIRRRVYAGALRRRQLLNQLAVEEEIERLIQETDDRFSFVRTGINKLTPALRESMAYVTRLVHQIPGPVDLSPELWDDGPLLNAFFISPQTLTDALLSSPALTDFFKSETADEAVALLTARCREKTVFGVEKKGDIVRRDIPQRAVIFEDHRVDYPAASLEESRKHFRHYALREILDLVLRRIDELESYKDELKEQQELLLFERQGLAVSRGLSDDNVTAKEDITVQEIQALLDRLKQRIEDIENDVDSVNGRFAMLEKVLLNPEAHLKLEKVSLKLNRLGIRLNESSTEEGNTFTIAVFELAELPKQAAAWVRVNRSTLSKEK